MKIGLGLSNLFWFVGMVIFWLVVEALYRWAYYGNPLDHTYIPGGGF